MPSTFHVRINEGKEQTVTIESSYYYLAAAAALGLIPNEVIDKGPVLIEVWEPSLLPTYGPYFYKVTDTKLPSEIILTPVVKAAPNLTPSHIS